jgi:hypothetical protein
VSPRRRASCRGATATEYLVAVACVAVVALGGFRAFGARLGDSVTRQADCLARMDGAGCVETGAPPRAGQPAVTGGEKGTGTAKGAVGTAPPDVDTREEDDKAREDEKKFYGLVTAFKPKPPADAGDDPWKDPYLRPERYEFYEYKPFEFGKPRPPTPEEQRKADRDKVDEVDRKYREWVTERYSKRTPPMKVLDDTGAGDAQLIVFGETHTPRAHPDFFKKLLPELKKKYPDIDTVFVEIPEGRQSEYDEFVKTGDKTKVGEWRSNTGGSIGVIDAARKLGLRVVCVDANETGEKDQTFDPKRDVTMAKHIKSAFGDGKTKKGVFIVGAAHIYQPTGVSGQLDGLSVKRYRVNNHFFATVRGGDFNAPPLDDDFPATRSTLNLKVDPGPWGFTTKTKTPAPTLGKVEERYDMYDGYIHIPELD